MSSTPDTITLKPFRGTVGQDLKEARDCFQTAQHLPLAQNWQPSPDRNFQPGKIVAAWCPEFFHILATFEDEDIVPYGKGHSKSILVISDIFQFFIERPSVGDYLELHVTPDNQSRTITWTAESLRAFQEAEISVDDILLGENNGITSQTWVEEDKAIWNAYLKVPAAVIDPKSPLLEPDLRLRGTFCRFDASPDSVAPVVSSTSTFTGGPRFHETAVWHQFLLG